MMPIEDTFEPQDATPRTAAGRDWLFEMERDYESSDAIEGHRIAILAIEAEAREMEHLTCYHDPDFGKGEATPPDLVDELDGVPDPHLYEVQG